MTRKQIAAVYEQALALRTPDWRQLVSDDALGEAALYFLKRTRRQYRCRLTLSLFLERARQRDRDAFGHLVAGPYLVGGSEDLAWWEAHQAEGVPRKRPTNQAE